jgi:hypothetical protein
MKKRKNPNKIDCVPIQNPVAKFAHQFNKKLSGKTLAAFSKS